MSALLKPHSNGNAVKLSAGQDQRNPKIIAARAVLIRPQDHSFDAQRAACLHLANYGDWLDRERALQLMKVLDAEETQLAQTQWETKVLRRLMWLVVGVVLAMYLGMVAVKAYGQYRYDVSHFGQVAVK